MLHQAVIVGDVHGQSETLAAVLSFAQNISVADVLCTGDLPAKGAGDLAHCYTLLDAVDARVVRGNHDRWRVADASAYAQRFGGAVKLPATTLTYLRRLPPLIEVATPNGLLLLCHGIGRDDMTGIYPFSDEAETERLLTTYGLADRYRYLVCGHTHQRLARSLFDGALIVVNAGILLNDQETPGFAIFNFDADMLQWYAIDAHTDTITAAEQVRL